MKVIWTDEMLGALHIARNNGMSYLACADHIGVSDGVISRKCRAIGLNERMNKGRTSAVKLRGGKK